MLLYQKNFHSIVKLESYDMDLIHKRSLTSLIENRNLQ